MSATLGVSFEDPRVKKVVQYLCGSEAGETVHVSVLPRGNLLFQLRVKDGSAVSMVCDHNVIMLTPTELYASKIKSTSRYPTAHVKQGRGSRTLGSTGLMRTHVEWPAPLMIEMLSALNGKGMAHDAVPYPSLAAKVVETDAEKKFVEMMRTMIKSTAATTSTSK